MSVGDKVEDNSPQPWACAGGEWEKEDPSDSEWRGDKKSEERGD